MISSSSPRNEGETTARELAAQSEGRLDLAIEMAQPEIRPFRENLLRGLAEPSYPVGGRIEVNIRSDYGPRAIFWYVMALILLIGFFVHHLEKLH